jgi:hypothetical protein
VLNNWHSTLGKSGHQAVVDLWLGDLAIFSSLEACVEYVEDALDGLKFIYKTPDGAKVSPYS